jgi:hypothetical protein
VPGWQPGTQRDQAIPANYSRLLTELPWHKQLTAILIREETRRKIAKNRSWSKANKGEFHLAAASTRIMSSKKLLCSAATGLT